MSSWTVQSPTPSYDSSPGSSTGSPVCAEWSEQLHSYVAWVNSHLKKKPGMRLVEDLRNDVRDGVALIHLIELVSGQKMLGIHLVPATQTEMKENIDCILQFMVQNHIRMHPVKASDIVDGNLKCIMRLILALAAHFKPSSVKHQGQTPNMASIVQGAAVKLANARRIAATAGNRYSRFSVKSSRSVPFQNEINTTTPKERQPEEIKCSHCFESIEAEKNMVMVDGDHYRNLININDMLTDIVGPMKDELLKLKNLLEIKQLSENQASDILSPVEQILKTGENHPFEMKIQQQQKVLDDVMEHISLKDEQIENLQKEHQILSSIIRTDILSLVSRYGNREDVESRSNDIQDNSETQVLCFSNRSETCYVHTIPKRLNEIKLKDIREFFRTSEPCCYYFKALDPEFGTIKVEISDDDVVLPGWGGKIVMWVEVKKS